MPRTRPDIVLIGPEWPERALLRAQLIEDGYEVVAFDAWPIPQLYIRSEMGPRVVIVDLRGLPEPRRVLDGLCRLVPPGRVLVLTALGTLPIEEIQQLGCRALPRPVSIAQIVAAAALISGRRPGASR